MSSKSEKSKETRDTKLSSPSHKHSSSDSKKIKFLIFKKIKKNRFLEA